MSQLKSLANQTAIYGVSSILGRLINYLLVWLHTTIFLPEALGIVTNLYAYIAILMIAFTYGMETAFFRYVKNDPKRTFQSAFTVVILISTTLGALIFFFSQEIADHIIGHPETSKYVKWGALIMWIDAFLAIPFAQLRFLNKAKKFASIKVVNILINVGFQFTLLSILPSFSDSITPSIGDIFLANLLANALIIIFLIKEISLFRFRFDMSVIKKLTLYSTPIFLMGLAGMLNEQLDKILIEYLLPDTFYPTMNSTAALGVYGQTFKLGVFMMLAVQAFRYAGEPFFFSKSEDKKAPELFAKIMHYFIISGLLLFTVVSINVDLIATIFLRRPDYRIVLYLVPLLLFGKLLYGVYLNISIWFKITDKTQYGLYFSVAGVAVTVAGNIFLIPVLGLLGSVLTMMGCYLLMCILCYIYGQKYFPVPYNFVAILPYLATATILVSASYYLHHPNYYIDMAVKLVISAVLIWLLWRTEKSKLAAKTS